MKLIIFVSLFLMVFGSSNLSAQFSLIPVNKNSDFDLDQMQDAVELGNKSIFSMYSAKQGAQMIVAYDHTSDEFQCLHFAKGVQFLPRLKKVGNKVFFFTKTALNKIWYTDGTLEGTTELRFGDNDYDAITTNSFVINNELLVSVYPAGSGSRSYFVSEDLTIKEIPGMYMTSILWCDTIHMEDDKILFTNTEGNHLEILPDNTIGRYEGVFNFRNLKTLGRFGEYSLMLTLHGGLRLFNRSTLESTTNEYGVPFFSQSSTFQSYSFMKDNFLYVIGANDYFATSFFFNKINLLTDEVVELGTFPGGARFIGSHTAQLFDDTLIFTIPVSETNFTLIEFSLTNDAIIRQTNGCKNTNFFVYNNYLVHVGSDGHYYSIDRSTGEKAFLFNNNHNNYFGFASNINGAYKAGSRTFVNIATEIYVSRLWEIREEDETLSVQISVQGKNDCVATRKGYFYPIVTGNSGPYTYQWTGGSTEFGYNYRVAQSDALINLTVYDKNGNSASAVLDYKHDAPAFNVMESVVPSPPDVAEGEIELEVTEAPGPYKYFWYHNASTSNEVKNLAEGEYKYYVLASNFCQREGTVEVPLTTSTNDEKEFPLIIYPTILSNNSRFIQIEYLQETIEELRLYNIKGVIQWNHQMKDGQLKTFYLPSNLSPGFYFLVASGQSGNYTQKLIVTE